MKKQIIILMIGILLIGANLYAAGDLEVNGKIGVGIDPSTIGAKLGINSTVLGRGLLVGLTTDNGALSSYGIDFSLDRIGSANLTGDVVAFAANVTIGDTADRTISGWVLPVSNNIRFNSSTPGTSTVSSPVFTNAYFSFVKHPNNLRTYTVTAAASNVLARGHNDDGTGGVINYSDLRNIWVQNSSFVNSSATALTGIWVDAITAGETSYGIVLDGDGAGSDIVFGPTQGSRIYSSGGVIYASDNNFNATQISPHDPETGEWIFYSKNIKTGITVRVNMEKLVKAVEKLTGETFMFETLMEDK